MKVPPVLVAAVLASISAVATANSTASTAAASGSGFPAYELLDNISSLPFSPSYPSSSNSGVSQAVIAVIAVSGILTGIGLALYGLYNSYVNKDRVSDRFDTDFVRYNIQEEYEARINFEVLDSLDPSVRAGIDMDILANMTNTDPKLLDKYRTVDTERRSSSLKGSLLYTSHESLHRHYSLTLQASLKKDSLDSTHAPGTLRRSNTISDVHSCTVGASIPSITMKPAKRSESKGSMFVVERQETDEFQGTNLLRVLSLSTNTARPRSMTELSEAEEDLAMIDMKMLAKRAAEDDEASDDGSRWAEAKEETNHLEAEENTICIMETPL